MMTATIRTLGVLLVSALLLGSCDADSACGCAISPRFRMEEWMAAARTVVVAEVVADGTDGDVVIRPTIWIKGSLPLDADGLYRFSWHAAESGVPEGVWAFGADGLPAWDAKEARTPAPVPEYPWPVDEYCAIVSDYGDPPSPVTRPNGDWLCPGDREPTATSGEGSS